MDETKVLAKELRKHERGRGKRYPKELEARGDRSAKPFGGE